MAHHQQPSLALSNALASPATSSKENIDHNQQTDAFDCLSNLNRKIRVLLVATRLTIGGDMNVILDIASYLNNHPHFEVHLAAGPVPAQEVDLTYLANERGIPLVKIPSMVTYINPWRNLRSSAELYAHMRRGKVRYCSYEQRYRWRSWTFGSSTRSSASDHPPCAWLGIAG